MFHFFVALKAGLLLYLFKIKIFMLEQGYTRGNSRTRTHTPCVLEVLEERGTIRVLRGT